MEAKNRTDFFSSEISGAHRLPNGNTLICAGVVGHPIALGTEIASRVEYSPWQMSFIPEKALAGRADHSLAFTRRNGHQHGSGPLNEPGRAVNPVAGHEQTLAVAWHADGRQTGLLPVLWRPGEDAVEEQSRRTTKQDRPVRVFPSVDMTILEGERGDGGFP